MVIKISYFDVEFGIGKKCIKSESVGQSCAETNLFTVKITMLS